MQATNEIKKERKPFYTILIEHRELPLLAVLLLFVVFMSVVRKNFLSENGQDILLNGAINMILSCGMLCVLLIGSIDISITAVVAFSGALAGILMQRHGIEALPLLLLVGLGVGMVIGLVNGLLMSYGRVISLIVTLSMSYIMRAPISMPFMLGMKKIPMPFIEEIDGVAMENSFSKWFVYMFTPQNTFLGIPFLLWVAIIIVVIVGVFLRYTKTGRSLYAVGSNAEAAEMRGVHINRVRVLAHTICGALAGLAGVIWLGRFGSIDSGAAAGEEMYVIAACVMGGVAVTGGYGKITGVVIGSVMIPLIDRAIPLLFPGNSMIRDFVKGILLVGVILLNVILQRISDKQDLKRRNI